MHDQVELVMNANLYFVHADRAQMITLTQTDIVGYIGENINVTGRVESCLSSPYKVQLFCPDNNENPSTNFIDCPTYNFSIPMKLNSSDNYLCTATIVNEHGTVQDSKSFHITGDPVYIIVFDVTVWYCNNT